MMPPIDIVQHGEAEATPIDSANYLVGAVPGGLMWSSQHHGLMLLEVPASQWFDFDHQ